MKKKIGLLGGTFNPPHKGHLKMAQLALKEAQLDAVYFLPNAVPPHKQQDVEVTDDQRLMMLAQLVQGQSSLYVCPFEIEKGGVSYTYETIRQLKKQYAEVDFYFIIGGDMIESLHTWVNIDELMNNVTFIGFDRDRRGITSPYPIQRINAPLVPISSTLIRNKVRAGENILNEVPEEVATFIQKEGLYVD